MDKVGVATIFAWSAFLGPFKPSGAVILLSGQLRLNPTRKLVAMEPPHLRIAPNYNRFAFPNQLKSSSPVVLLVAKDFQL
jgi:hypothetical protein